MTSYAILRLVAKQPMGTQEQTLMAVIALCEPQHLFNLLNQRVAVSRLAEINYLCLIDARETQDYNISHIITARHAKTNAKGAFLPLENVEIDTMQNIVVCDGKTDCLDDPGRAYQCAKTMAKSSSCVVHILRGGFQKFSALYPFLRTEKILYTIKELEDVRAYPVEIIPERVYMGSEKQSNSRSVMEDLKINALVCISTRDRPVGKTLVHRMDAEIEADKAEFCFEEICNYIDSHTNSGSRILIVSLHGSRRCSAAATAYVMHHYKYSLQEAWRHVQTCKHNAVFDKRFKDHLCDWEKRVGTKSSNDPD